MDDQSAGTKTEPRYSLRESSKHTSRYRDYIGATIDNVQETTANDAPPQDSLAGADDDTHQQSSQTRRNRAVQARRQLSGGIQMQQVVVKAPISTADQDTIQTFGDSIGAEQEVSTSEYARQEVGAVDTVEPRAAYRYKTQPSLVHDRRFNAGAELLTDELKSNLRKLKNVLKLPKARRFVFCEFFYSGVDQQIFLAENEFSQLLHESFPNLKCKKLRKPEWREVRRLIGKPRRCSQAFFEEERNALEEKRQRIRAIYNGTCTSLNDELIDLPAYLPRPPVVGLKIYARIRSPKDGIYAATVDAISADGYRVVFDDPVLQPCVIKDYEVMFGQPSELLAINYFLEQNRACNRGLSNKTTTGSHPYHVSTTGYMNTTIDGGNKAIPVFGIQEMEPISKKATITKDEKVGNFPVRMLVILVKLCKVIEYKKQLIGQLTLMNNCAERMSMLTNEYPEEFKIEFSQLIIDLEMINRLFRNYLSALQTHYNTLLPHLNEPQPTDRPELLRKTCNTHAFQIVKHCNSELNVRDKRILHLITSLTSIMLQLRTIGINKKKFSTYDVNILSESLKHIRSQIASENTAAFQDYVEVNMKQMLCMMNK